MSYLPIMIVSNLSISDSATANLVQVYKLDSKQMSSACCVMRSIIYIIRDTDHPTFAFVSYDACASV